MKTKLFFFIVLIPFLCTAQFRLIKDIISGSDGSSPYNFVEFNGEIFFYSNAPLATNERINTSDATELGTVFLKDQNGNDLIPELIDNLTDWGILNNEIFFPAQNLTDGVELYKLGANDANATLVLEIASGNANSSPFGFVNLGSKLIFAASDQINGRELWITDGTTSGTQLLKDIDSAFDGNPKSLYEYNGRVYFTATNITNGTGEELWVTDGTASGTVLIKDIAPGVTNSTPRNFIGFNGKVYFTSNDGTNGRELWVTNGTSAGTYMVQDLNTTSGVGSSPSSLTIFNDNLIFAANVTGVGTELLKMNPSETITSLGNINPTGDSSPEGLTVFNGMLYFSADNGTTGRELYSTNGFQAGTGIVADINTSGDSNPLGFLVYNGKLYFGADNGVDGNKLWSYDNINGAQLIPGLTGGSPIPKIVYQDELVLSIGEGTTGRELWSYTDPSFQTFVPDDNFEQTLISLGYDSIQDDFVNTGNINGVKNLTVNGNSMPISDFTGLQDFKSIQYFSSFNNTEPNLDFTNNSNLVGLTIFGDQNINSVSLSQSTNPYLDTFTYANGNLASIDLSNFESLQGIAVQGSANLMLVDISNCINTNLIVDIQNAPDLVTVDVTDATALRQLYVNGSGNLNTLDPSTAINLTDIGIINSGLQSLDLSNNTSLDRVLVQNNQLMSLNVKNGTNSIIVDFNATGNSNLSCINVDDESAANAGTGVYASWQKDTSTVYSENCATLSVDEIDKSKTYIYPNPAYESFKINGINHLNDTSLKIYDLTGKLVLEYKEIQDTYKISSLDEGIYIIEINTKNGITFLKMIKD